MIKGNPDTADDQEGDNSKLAVFQAMMQARMLVLGDKKIYDNNVAGAEPDAYYLKKEYDVAGMEANDSRTVAAISYASHLLLILLTRTSGLTSQASDSVSKVGVQTTILRTRNEWLRKLLCAVCGCLHTLGALKMN